MPDPTGRWLNARQWQCPKCSWVNSAADESCQKCSASVRPPENEPARPPDPLDLIGHKPALADVGHVERATNAVRNLSRVTHDRAVALIGTALKNRRDAGDPVWQLITEMPDEDQREALGSVVDDLEKEGVALYRIDGDEAR